VTDRVPDDVLRRIQDDDTPTIPPGCAPECHQGARIDALTGEVRRLRDERGEDRRAILEALSGLTGTVRGLEVAVGAVQGQVTQLALVSARTATLAGETASHQAMTPAEAEQAAPSMAPVSRRRSRLPKPAQTALAAAGIVLGAAAATAVTRCTEALAPTGGQPAPQSAGGP
jgi:hypothetical protein